MYTSGVKGIIMLILKSNMKKIYIFLTFLLVLFTSINFTLINPVKAEEENVEVNEEKSYYRARVIDAEQIEEYNPVLGANTQNIRINILTGPKKNLSLDSTFSFPNTQIKRPLKIGDIIIIETDKGFNRDESLRIIGLYKQNFLLIWTLILLGSFILISGFKRNKKFFLIFFLTILSGLIVIFTYRYDALRSLLLLVGFQLISMSIFTFQIFRKRTPSILFTGALVINQLLGALIVFVMETLNIFDSTFFHLFLNSEDSPNDLGIFIFSIIALFPISIFIADQIISESLKIKNEEPDITRIKLVKNISVKAINSLINIYLAFFGFFFAIFVMVIALSSNDENLIFLTLNSNFLSQIMGMGFLIIIDTLVFIPIISLITGFWLGSIESHKIIDDKNIGRLGFKRA
jgi:hypothetical protein